MSIRPAAVVTVPAAPVLIDDVAGSAAELVAQVRDAAVSAIAAALRALQPTEVALVATLTGRHRGAARAGVTGPARLDLSPIGVDLSVGQPGVVPLLTPAAVELAVGAYLLEQAVTAAAAAPPRVLAIDLTGREATALHDVADGALVIAIADGSAARDATAPGYIAEGAVAYDEALIEALRRGDLAWFTSPASAAPEEFLVGGLPVWRALAEVLPAITRSEVHAVAAPLGVNYVVATWDVAG